MADSHNKTPKKIVDIEVWVTYCHPNGQRRRRELDTTEVKGIVWDMTVHNTTIPDEADVDTTPDGRLRFKGKHEDLGRCSEDELASPAIRLMAASDSAACCWWDGTRWICPDEVE